MSSWVNGLLAAAILMAPHAGAASLPAGVHEIGRVASSAEVRAWDIDVRPDFAGLPPGSGDVWAGEEIWLEKCASCHGDFGDSNEVFAPIVLGNVTEDDIAAGNVASLKDPAAVRTTLMKVATLSTLWDYIYRAMPWNAPKSLTPDEVYALLAYILNLGYVVDDDFVLSDDTIHTVQARMPNRNGMRDDHGLWSVDGQPDVVSQGCQTNCVVSNTVSSSLPAYAMNAHGNLAEQSRAWGPYPGLWTAPEDADSVYELAAAEISTEAERSDSPAQILNAAGCMGCHQMAGQLVGPGFDAVRERYAGAEHVAYLKTKITQGGAGVWGSIPMPGVPLQSADLDRIVAWMTASEAP